MSCLKKCEHERHLVYLDAFRVLSIFDYIEFMTKFVLDPNISSDNEDDLDLFKDFVFGRLGNIQNYYYEHLFYDHPAKLELTCAAFCKFLGFLKEISDLYTQAACNYIFKMGNLKLIELSVSLSSHDIKMEIIRASNNFPHITKRIPKLKLYNLFS